MRRKIFALPVLILCLFAWGPGFGQSSKAGSVSGTVKDSSGAALPSAQIALQPGSTTVISNAQGDFRIPNLTPGTYTVTISVVGFANSVSDRKSVV